MDTQGHESFIIQGAKKTLKKKIPIVMEFQPNLMPKDWLKRLNNLFRYYKYFYNLSEPNKNKEKLNIESIYNLYRNIKKIKTLQISYLFEGISNNFRTLFLKNPGNL